LLHVLHLFVGGLAVACITAPAAQPKPRDDGHIAGSLVDLLDQDGWEQSPVEMHMPGEFPKPEVPASENDAAQGQDRIGVEQQPPKPDPNDAARLDALIKQRHALVDGCKFFELINQNLKAQQQVVAANNQLVQANIAIGKANTDINIARVQKNEALEARARRNLDAAQRAAGQAANSFQQAVQNNQRLWGQLEPNIVEFLDLYQKMKAFVVQDRVSPRLAAARGVFERACAGRADFHEGQVLAALCEIYVGQRQAAHEHLKKGLFFGQELFFAWPPASEMCLAYLLLGQPAAVNRWVKWVQGLDEKRKTPTRCFLVALHGVIDCRDNQAAEWFERCGRRLTATAKKQNRPVEMPAEVAGAWAHFVLTCPNTKFRDVQKAKGLVGGLQPRASWYVARAKAAVAAAEESWQGGVRETALAVQHGPVVLGDELNGELEAYKNSTLWTRSRPAKN
jgi:tetratricopeptide (TPR) repeat protein